ALAQWSRNSKGFRVLGDVHATLPAGSRSRSIARSIRCVEARWNVDGTRAGSQLGSGPGPHHVAGPDGSGSDARRWRPRRSPLSDGYTRARRSTRHAALAIGIPLRSLPAVRGTRLAPLPGGMVDRSAARGDAGSRVLPLNQER